MAVDLLGPLRQAYGTRIQSELELANREERERQRREAQRQNGIANMASLAGAAIGGAYGGPAGAAAGASIGNMAGRAISGGQAPSVGEVAQTGAALYGLSADAQQTSQNTKINQALTQNAINELQGGLPQGMTPQSATAQSSQRLAGVFGPGVAQDVNVAAGTVGSGVEPGVNVVAGTAGETPQDARLAGLLGPGMSTQQPNPQQQKSLDAISALTEMREGGLGRMKPGEVAAVAQGFLPKKGDILQGAPGTGFFRQMPDGSLKNIGSVPAKDKSEQTFEVRVGRGPNAQVVSTGVSLEAAQTAVKENPGAVIYKTSTEPSNTGEGTGLWMRFNAYADQRVQQVNELRAKSGQPPLNDLESKAFHSRVVDELNREDFQRETVTIDPITQQPARRPGLKLGPVEKLVADSAKPPVTPPTGTAPAGPLTTAAPISAPRETVIERKQLTPEQFKGLTGSGTALELMNVLNENVQNTGFITGPAKEFAQRSGFMKPDGTLDFALAKARLDNIAQDIIKGIPSNFDVQTFQKTLAKVGEDPEANKVAIRQGVRQLARAMAEQIDYAKKFNLDVPEQALQTAKEFGVDVDSIMSGKSGQRITFDKPLGVKIDPFVPASARDALNIAKTKNNKGKWIEWNGELRQIQ